MRGFGDREERSARHGVSYVMRIFARVALLPITLPLVGIAGAQAPRVQDQGSLTITINGQRAGREDFRIAVTPRGGTMEYLATATVDYGDRRLEPALRADSVGVPMSYQVSLRGTEGGPERWVGQISRGRVSAQIHSSRGPAAREYIVSDGAIIVDDDVFHQYAFVARHRDEGAVTILVPRRNTQMRLRIATAGAESVQIGTQEIDATHVVLTEPSGARREVWVDGEGRLLKVSIPARGIVALRDDPPR